MLCLNPLGFLYTGSFDIFPCVPYTHTTTNPTIFWVLSISSTYRSSHEDCSYDTDNALPSCTETFKFFWLCILPISLTKFLKAQLPCLEWNNSLISLKNSPIEFMLKLPSFRLQQITFLLSCLSIPALLNSFSSLSW